MDFFPKRYRKDTTARPMSLNTGLTTTHTTTATNVPIMKPTTLATVFNMRY